MKKILGMNLRPNSIEYTLFKQDFVSKQCEIQGMVSQKNPTEYAGLRNLRLIALL